MIYNLNIITKFKDVIETYWSNFGKFQGIKGTNNDNFKFINIRNLFSLECPHLSFDFGGSYAPLRNVSSKMVSPRGYYYQYFPWY